MTTPSSSATCPACRNISRHLTDWEFSGLGESVFNYIGEFQACEVCGLAYIRNRTDAELSIFYADECAYFSSDHFDINSDENIKKYKAYKKVLADHGLNGKRLLDVGCGRGGFLHWLTRNSWSGPCCGVDADRRSIPAPEGCAGNLSFKHGFAFDLPVDSGSQEIISYFHVLEHLRDLDRALDEAVRATTPDGHLLIEIPDAENYRALPIGTAFWVGIREHVNHFSAAALAHLLQRKGFRIKNMVREVLPTPEFVYPSLLVLAQKSGDGDACPPASRGTGDVASFILDSQAALRAQASQVTAIMGRYARTTFWGCSAQLFSLLPLLDLDRVTLCDSSELKQKSNYKGRPICAPSAVAPTGALVVAPYLHRQAIERAALGLGWSGSDIFFIE